VLGLLAVVFFLALNGFFVAAEFALVKLRATFPGSASQSDMVAVAVSKLDRYLAVSQVGITVASLVLGWIGEPVISEMVGGGITSLLGHPLGRTADKVLSALSLAILTYVHVLLGEQVPKLFAIRRSRQVAELSAWPMRIAYYVMWPGLRLLEVSTNFVLRMLGLPADAHGEANLSEDEILGILAAHVARGHGAEDKQDLIRRMLRFSQRTAKQAMVPRLDVLYVPMSIPGASALEFLRAHEYSRVPLSKGEELDEVVGYLYWKDFLRDAKNIRLPTLDPLRRDILFVPESQALVNVLREMQKTQIPMAVVVDEYGGTSGILTMEDLLEEIVGEIRDETDVEAQRIERRADVWEVDGGVQLDELESEGIEVGQHDEGTTVGGAVLEALGRIPRVGDVAELGKARAEVIAVARRRIVRVRLKPQAEA
jgi:CBS domain containing-hemolysin-like protein